MRGDLLEVYNWMKLLKKDAINKVLVVKEQGRMCGNEFVKQLQVEEA